MAQRLIVTIVLETVSVHFKAEGSAPRGIVSNVSNTP
jgi:hypothetical protein